MKNSRKDVDFLSILKSVSIHKKSGKVLKT